MKETVYKFKGVNDLYCNLYGTFFYKGKLAKKVYNNGSVSILCGKTKYGLIKLRSLAYKCEIENNDDCPF